ncbi:HPr kinase/phosphatase C-terminal domain-containing protein [Aureimonas sp. SK2]|uniref:HPr kinase/phosphorylase n=1 Tax=Aureimonas sp. SK2 TaxID=3015992 RepID=UPI0024441637|nr:HPr kinase/phosphatase C-terminal domain-containing protein [Aureimonas sp. SK2]
MSEAANVHATALRLDGRGLLVRGPSGSGKSSLALSVLRRAEAAGLEAALVADDQVLIHHESGFLVARAPKAIAGLIEIRGVGILTERHVAETRLHLVVDLGPRDRIERLPDPGERVEVAGLGLRRIRLPERDPAFGADVLLTLAGSDAFWKGSPAS